MEQVWNEGFSFLCRAISFKNNFFSPLYQAP
jgi:hypothetical protein